jgi:putative cell wall-binding protein
MRRQETRRGRRRRDAGAVAVLVGVLVTTLVFVRGAPPASALADDAEWDFAARINEARFQAGLPPLGVLPVLRDLGRIHSARMAARGTLYHNPDLRTDVTARVPDWQRAGENVGTGGDVASLHQAFMNSPGHRANVLGDYNYVGLGVVEVDGVTWVTEVFVKAPDGKAIATRVPVTRVGAPSDADTAIAMSSFGFRDHESAAVVVARAELFADALAGGPLAATRNGPVLLVPGGQLSPPILDEARRVLAPNGVVYVLGGVDALPASVDLAFTLAGLRVQRVAGADRYATAVAIAVLVNPQPARVLVASGVNFADAMVAGVPAGRERSPVVLVEPDRLPDPSATYLAGTPGPRIVIGGTAAVSDAVKQMAGAADRVAGADRYETSVRVAERFFTGLSHVSLTTGASFPDALVGAPWAARAGVPILLVSNAPTAATYEFVHGRVDSLAGSVVVGSDIDVPARPLALLLT